VIKIIVFLVVFVSIGATSEYEKWLQSQQNEYQTYKKSMDDEFAQMLKKDWETYKGTIYTKQYVKPKPTLIPVAKKEIQYPKKQRETSKKVTPPKKIVKTVIKKPVMNQKFPLFDARDKRVKFNFYNQKITIQYDKKFYFHFYRVNKNNISDTWQHLSKTNFKSVIEQIKQYSKQYAFNDWAKYLLIHKLGLEIYKGDQNSANLFTWFILVKMGYDTKVGYSKNNIYLLSLVKQNLYQVAFFTLQNKKYYILTPKGKINSIGALYTYVSNYPDASDKLSFDMSKKAINITSNIEYKNLNFQINHKHYNIKTAFSKDLVSFYKNFPQSEYPLYFSSQTSQNLSNSLLYQLQSLIKEKTELEAVNLLLHFVQTSFKYETDAQQFGYEKVLFPEETIYYRYSDCEDRSILFSYLVKNLLGLPVVGIKYKNHLADAVAFSTNISGDGFRYKNKKYIITDPTYINAKAGMTMPKYKDARFTLVQFN